MAEEIVLESLLVGELPCDLKRVEKFKHEHEEAMLQRMDDKPFIFNATISACIYRGWPADLVNSEGFSCKSVGVCKPTKAGVVRVIAYVVRGIPEFCDIVAYPFDVLPPLTDESGANIGGNGYRLVPQSQRTYPLPEEYLLSATDEVAVNEAIAEVKTIDSSKKRVAEEPVDATIVPISKRRKRNL